MQDEVITRLAKIGELRVISRDLDPTLSRRGRRIWPRSHRSSASRIWSKAQCSGSATASGSTCNSIRAANESHLWAEIYDRNLTDIFAVQSELATRIAESLQATLSGAERKAVAEKPTSNLAAYDAYLRGIDLSSRPGQTEENQRKAADAYAEATRLDPQFTEAWAALCTGQRELSISCISIPAAARKEAARVAAETATRLNPSSPETLLGQRLLSLSRRARLRRRAPPFRKNSASHAEQ